MAARDVSFRYDPDRAALVVIDVQNDFCDPAGALGSVGVDMSAVQGMVPRLLSLIEAARATTMPVIFVNTQPTTRPRIVRYGWGTMTRVMHSIHRGRCAAPTPGAVSSTASTPRATQ